MRKLQVRVMYEGEIDPTLDESIKSTMKKVGCRWWAQGWNFKSGIRDICFNMLVNHKNAV